MPSAFVRKTGGPSGASTSKPLSGTFPCPSSPSVHLVSTGIPSFDDILGGGAALGSILSVLAPDNSSSWSKLIERYWISQGFVASQDVCVISAGEEEDLEDLVRGCMWVDPGMAKTGTAAAADPDSDAEGLDEESGNRTKIAWRYEKMNRFQTTVSAGASALNLTQSLPSKMVDDLKAQGQLQYVAGVQSLSRLLAQIQRLLTERKDTRVLRIVVHELGSYEWNVGSTQIHRFLHSLREIIVDTPTVVMLTFPPELSRGSSWVDSLSWVSSGGCYEFQGFADDPSLSISFPHSHGLVHVHSLPSPCTLLPPAYKHSTLLGLGVGSSGQNNLAFKLKRKRFIIETLHLGVEGGVGDRRTEPSSTGGAIDTKRTHASHTHSDHHEGHQHGHQSTQGVEIVEEVKNTTTRFKAMDVGWEEAGERKPTAEDSLAKKPKKERKKVSFIQHDKPELYDF